jgi:ABC-type lipoprotein export system ATPase subunit
MGETFVTVRDLVKTYQTPAGPLNVLRGLSLDVRKGDFVALVGPSGSGKTTFLNMLTAIDAPTSGTITIGDLDITRSKGRRLTKWRAKHVGIVFQFFQLLPTMSVLANVMAPMDFARVWKSSERPQRALKLLDYFGIADQAQKMPDMLSGGQQQRVALARALANSPALVIADEPTGNLDRMSARRTFEAFQRLSEQGTTVIIVTHDRELVKDVPTIYEISDGLIGQTTLVAAARRRTQERAALQLARARS